jgi:RNA polymerase sigma factor (sigma-70 family)
MPPTPIEPTSLLDLYRRWRVDGDDSARDPLLAAVQPLLHAEASRLLGTSPRAGADSLDLAQSAVVNFLKWGPRYLPESDAEFRAALKRIAKNQIIDADRRQSLRGRGGHVESMQALSASFAGFGPAARSSESPSAEAGRNEDGEWMRLALQFLDPDDRHLLWSSEVENRPWAEIAEEVGLDSPDAARVRCARLKPKVARLLLQLRAGRTPADA